MFLLSALCHKMLRPNWPSSGVQGARKSLLYFRFGILDTSGRFIKVMLPHAFASYNVFGLSVVCTSVLYGGYDILFLLFGYSICAVTHVF